MKITMFLIPVIALTLFGCGGHGSDTPAAPVLNAITDMTNCHGAAPSGSSIFGKWVSQAQKNQLVVVTAITIETKDVKSTITCQTATGIVDPKNPIDSKAQTIETDLIAPSTVSGNQLILTKSTITSPPVPNVPDPACSKSLDDGTYTYQLVGQCLLLSNDISNFYFVKQ